MPRDFKPLTPAQVARFRSMWDGGAPVNEIAAEFGVTRNTVQVWAIERFGLAARRISPANLASRPAFEVRDTEPVGALDSLPSSALRGRPARPRPGDRPGERWVQLV